MHRHGGEDLLPPPALQSRRERVLVIEVANAPVDPRAVHGSHHLLPTLPESTNQVVSLASGPLVERFQDLRLPDRDQLAKRTPDIPKDRVLGDDTGPEQELMHAGILFDRHVGMTDDVLEVKLFVPHRNQAVAGAVLMEIGVGKEQVGIGSDPRRELRDAVIALDKAIRGLPGSPRSAPHKCRGPPLAASAPGPRTRSTSCSPDACSSTLSCPDSGGTA